MKHSTAVLARCAKSLALCLLLPSPFAMGDPVEWTNTVGGAWSLADNWNGGIVPDAADTAVLFGSAIPAPATVTLDGPRVVGDITLNSANAYTLAGSPLTLNKTTGTSTLLVSQGSHTIASDIGPASTVLSVVTDPGAALTLAGSLSGVSDKRLEKTGEGTLALSGPSGAFAGTVAAANGTLALQGTALPGALSVAAPGTLSVLPVAASGLMGYYYNVASYDANNFVSLEALEAHFAVMTPNLAASSSLAGSTFDFGATGELFPPPYNSTGSHADYFEAVWRGTLTVPASANYVFRVIHDDGFLLAIDGKLVSNAPSAVGTTDAPVFLAAGPHEMVLGYYEVTGAAYLQVQYRTFAESTFTMLPNSMLTPSYSSVGALSGNGAAALSAGSSLRVAHDTPSAFSGHLSGPAGSLFAKSGAGALALISASAVSNAFEGNVAVQGGVLSIATPERIGDAATVTVASGAGLKLTKDETLGALAGAGTVTLGGCGYVYKTSFSGDADSGLSTAKTYTHKLDFPADGLPATVNDVVFTAAGMSGSADGYSWSTVTPPVDNVGNASSGVEQLLSDFYYGRPDYTLTLSDLSPGQTYETRLYFKSWGAAQADSPRDVIFMFRAGAAVIGSIDHDLDTMTRSMVVCRYTADAAGTLSVRVISRNPIHTCHLYGLSNEKAAAPVPPVAPPAPATSPSWTAFTDDADSGISAAKTYTHKLDFPTFTPPATVNGVTFTAAGMAGSADGYSWSTVTPPTGTWGDAGGAGVENLLWDFIYNSTDFTLTLSGLHPGQTYETRIYFRSFGGVGTDTTRDITVTFTAGATVIGSINHDIDTLARSRIDCRYTADAAGTVAIRVFSYNSGSTCHLYGLSNEEVNDLPTLTLDAPAGSVARHTGAVNGFGTLIKKGEGTQVFGGANSLVTPLDVQAGTASLESGASVLSGAVVRAGATLAAPNGNVRLGGLEGEGTFRLAGSASETPYIAFFTNDVSSGISSSKVYTHKLDFGVRSPAAVINGVTFDKVSSQNGAIGLYGWVNFPPNTHGGNAPEGEHGVPAGSGVYDLLYDMDFGWTVAPNTPATMQLTGLTPGQRYEVRLYNRSWGWGSNRTQGVTFDPDGEGPLSEVIVFNPDSLNPNFLAYRYIAAGSVLNITLQSSEANASLHLYGLSNEEAADAGSSPVTVDITKDSLLSGPVTGVGGWVKTGAATLLLSGAGTATGPLAVSSGALGVGSGGCATLGPVSVAEGATLFGDGSVGGNVTVNSNAWLMAGSASACGTLQVGGALSLAQGVRLAYHFGADGNDTVTVGGTLTFPASGVVQASAVTPGANAPAKDVFFSSAETIVGPADLTGWTVEGVDKASLMYSDDRKTIYFSCPRGTLILLL